MKSNYDFLLASIKLLTKIITAKPEDIIINANRNNPIPPSSKDLGSLVPINAKSISKVNVTEICANNLFNFGFFKLTK